MTTRDLQRGGTLRVAVIGAGMAGLGAARVLVDRGHQVTLFDKGRGPGGRTSSRRAEPFSFDHGAQYFTAREAAFRERVEGWLRAGVVARWEGRLVALDGSERRPVRPGTERFVGVPRMSALAKHLAESLDVNCGVRIEALEQRPVGWSLTDAAGASWGPFDRLMITAPPLQARALLGERTVLGERLAGFSMQPCWAVLIGCDRDYGVEFDGAFCDASALSWVARNNSKPGRPGAEAWVLHATPAWTADHLEQAPARVVELLTAELERVTGQPLPPILHRDAHRWLFALPESSQGAEVLEDEECGLILAGDAYCGGRVEGAYLSGVAAAQRWL